MKVIPKLQQGNTIESDNTKVVRPEIHEPIKAKPKQYSIVDLGGEPSNDTRSAAERNRDYWHPIKGAKARFRASMSNETNPLVGIERTILPSAAGAALVTTPAAVVGGALGNMTVDKLTGGWGNWLEDKTGIPSEIGVYTNPGAWYGGAKGYKIGKDKLITKSIKGDADLAWNPINKNHWIFNKEARTPSNIAMATANRITPFLSKVEKLPLKVAALMDKVGRPFILQQSNPIWIEGKSVRNPELVTMAHGGRFDFKKSPLLKKQEEINGKRDMRKKFIKSSRPTYKKRIKKAQQGMRFVSYNPVSNPTIDYTDITNPINPFSEYNFNTVYDKPEALVVPVRDTNEPDVVANNPIAEPVINKPVASKSVTDKPVTKTANSTWKSPYTNRKQWSTELINAYKKAGITNDNAIRMLLAQDALESSWGKSAQGKYNFGNLTTGSSWKGDYVTGNDKNAKGEAIKQKFRSYNSMDEYAADKVQFLKRLYDFDENDDINKFVAKLTGSNKGKRRYAEATNYAKVLTGVYNGIPKGENGMIIKYQNPAQPIKYMGGYDKRGNMVLPVNNENGMNNVTLPEVTVTPRNINLAGAVDRGRRTVGNMGKEILSATTPLGDIESAKDIYQDARSGNYGQAALGAGLLLLPNFIEKPLKTLKRVGKDYVIITKDFVSSPKRFRQARKDGTYPLTYKERRRYLEEAHKVGDKAAARVDAANIGDYQYRVNNYPNTYHAVNLVDGVNTRYTFNSKSYKNFDDANHSSGVNSSSWNINSHINIKKSPNSKYLIPTGGADGVGANVAHELQHSYQKVLPDITLMTSTRNGQRLVNEEHITANALAPLKGKAGTWEGNPRELNSEVMSIRTGLNAPRYNLMTPEQQGIMKYYIGRKFDLDDNVVHNMLNELGKLGYKNGGKL